MKLLNALILLLVSAGSFAQARLVLNNNPYVVMDGGSAGTPIYIVLENSNANAITELGPGGNIVSEDEYNILRWQVGTATGSYNIPWYTQQNAAGVKIPLTMNITGAGAGGTNIDLSTYRTSGIGSGSNAPLPSMVTHMMDANTATVNNELNVIDRFWLFKMPTYVTRPNVSLTIGYDDGAEELTSVNTVVEADLVAQRFNSTANLWEGQPGQTGVFYGSGTLNAGANTIGPFAVAGGDWFEAWTLSNINSLLPIELIYFNGRCDDNKLEFNWLTGSELNNDFFTIQGSMDGVSYFDLATIAGAGNSSSALQYAHSIENQGYMFYRLKQTDYNGDFSTSEPITFDCETNSTEIVSSYQNESELFINVNSTKDQNAQLIMYGVDGKLIESKNVGLFNGSNLIQFDRTGYSNGIYMINLVAGDELSTTKIYLR